MESFTAEDVQEHNQETDCWVIINQKVYNITDWLNIHPGGTDVLFAQAGKNATGQFIAVGHSSKAKDKLETMLVGRLEDDSDLTTFEHN